MVGAARRAARAEARRRRRRPASRAGAAPAPIEVDVAVDDSRRRRRSSCSRPTRVPRSLPLTKVASGGELARTMLALRLVLTAHDDDPVGRLDAGVRRGRRRHRRGRGDRRRRGVGRRRRGAPGARRDPPRPGRGLRRRRSSPSPRRVVGGDHDSHGDRGRRRRRVAEIARMLSGRPRRHGGPSSTPASCSSPLIRQRQVHRARR